MAENHVLLETIELTQTTTTITFDNIPQTGYTDLKYVMSLRASTSSGNDSFDLLVNFNGSSLNKSTASIRGDGSGVNYNAIGDRLLRLVNPSDYTSNVFSNVEFYVPNYTGNKNKVFNVDGVLENNATGSAQIMIAGAWASTAAITSMSFTPNGSGAAFVAGTSISLYGVAALGTTPTVAPKADGGNIVANDGTYWYHAFTTSGTFTPQTSLSCEVLAVGGGAGGGGNIGGAGGAGELDLFASNALALSSPTNYSVTVGASGAGGGNNIQGGDGTSSTFSGTGISTITALGGGGGGTAGGAGRNGGSGGGGAPTLSPGAAGGSASGSNTNAGGIGLWNNSNGNYAGGGGGGATAAGGNGSGSTGGSGGQGYALPAGLAGILGVTHVASGGGGSGEVPGSNAGTGGTAGTGGGNGGGWNIAAASATSYGSGGGGGRWESRGGSSGGNGFQGIVIVRYTMV